MLFRVSLEVNICDDFDDTEHAKQTLIDCIVWDEPLPGGKNWRNFVKVQEIPLTTAESKV